MSDSVLAELNDDDKNIIKDSIIEIYRKESVSLERKDIEIIMNVNGRLLLRRLEKEMNIEAIITIPEDSTKKEIMDVAQKLLNSNALNEEIKETTNDKETILKDVEIEVVRVEDKTIYPTGSNNSEGSDDDDDDFLFGLSLYVFIGIVGGVALLLILIIICCCCCLCRSKKSEHSFKAKKPKAVAEKGVKASGSKEVEMSTISRAGPVPPTRRV